MISVVETQFPRQKKVAPRRRHDPLALRETSVRNSFAELFEEAARAETVVAETLDDHASRIAGAFELAAASLPQANACPNKPWISCGTMGIIEHRNEARRAGNYLKNN